MSLLITPTVLNSYDWLKKCPPSWKKKAYDDLSNMLNRKWVPPKPAVQRGIDFEKYVCRRANQKIIQSKGTPQFQGIIKTIQGGQFQKKCKFYIEVEGKEYCCYGKIDVAFPDLIIDIKTTGSYRGKNSYLSGWQHKFYTIGSRVPNFLYLIVEFDGEQNKIIEVYEVEYRCDNPAEVKEEITNTYQSS